MRTLMLCLTISVSFFTCLGCQLTPTFSTGYEYDSTQLLSEPLDSTLAVLRFEDARPGRLYTSMGKLWMTYVPLLPYVKFPYERLEESVQVQTERSGGSPGNRKGSAPELEQYAYPKSFAQAIAEDLDSAGLFEDVVYIGETGAGDHRYILEGTLKETPYRYAITSFMFGAPGVLLWLLPIPVEKATGEIDLDLKLTDRQTGNTIWTHNVHGEVSRLYSLYTGSAMVYGRGGAWALNVKPPPRDSGVDRRSLFSWHFAALRRGMAEAKPSLAEAIAKEK